MLPRSLKALIFDLDGTLYRQLPVRLLLLFRLIRSNVFCPVNGVRTARALFAFRRAQELLRASGVGSSSVIEEQVKTASAMSNLNTEFVRSCAARWMDEEPLNLLRSYRRRDVEQVLSLAKKMGLALAVFSDYPAERKLLALELAQWFDIVVSAQDPAVGEFKPNPRGLLLALEKLAISPKDALYIGDRIDVDALAAKRAGVPFFILTGSTRRRYNADSSDGGYRWLMNQLIELQGIRGKETDGCR